MARGTVLFDYDGTLHNSMRIYGPALRSAIKWLEDEGWLEPASYSDEWISRWLGWTTKDMWTTFAPQLPQEVWTKASAMVGTQMDNLTASGKGALFDGVPQMLQELLDDGWELGFLSNCRCAYRDAHRRQYELDRWISAYYCAENYPGMAKWEIYESAIRTSGHPLPHVMIGDRFHDIEVGTKAHIATIGCRYGYGEASELDAASACVDNPLQIPETVKELLS